MLEARLLDSCCSFFQQVIRNRSYEFLNELPKEYSFICNELFSILEYFDGWIAINSTLTTKTPFETAVDLQFVQMNSQCQKLIRYHFTALRTKKAGIINRQDGPQQHPGFHQPTLQSENRMLLCGISISHKNLSLSVCRSY